MDVDKEILDSFVVESREHLNVVEDELLNLEKQSGDAQDEESINRIFRGIHTIKGGAGFMALEKINALSHVMETLLSMVRSNEITADGKIIDALLAGVDLLRTMLDNVDHQQDIDISKAMRRLNQLLTRRVSKETQMDLKKEVPLPDIEGKETGFTMNEFQRKKCIEDKLWLFILQYDLHELGKTKKKGPLALIEELELVGDILDGRIETALEDFSKSFQEVPLIYHVLFVSQLEPDKLLPVIGLDKNRLNIIFQGEGAQVTPLAEDLTPLVEKDEATPEKKSPQETNEPIEEIMPTELGKSETVRINVELLDRLMNLAGELVLVRNQQLNNMGDFSTALKSITQSLDLVTTEMQELIMLTRMQPIGTVLGKYPRFVREMSRKLGKQIDIHITGSEVELDRTILESLNDPLTHIIRNSCDHGIETPEERKKAGKPKTGTITINVSHEAGQISIDIIDNGRGLDAAKIKQKALQSSLCSEDEIAHMSTKEMYALVLRAGFSTAEKVSDLSGRGVGLDVVKSNIEKLNGSLDLDSTQGKGTSLRLKLPLTLAIIPCLLVRVNEDRFAIPQVNLEELVSLYDEDALTLIECAEERELFRLRDRLLPLVRLSEVLANPVPFDLETRAEITENHRQERDRLHRQVQDHQRGIWLLDEAQRTLSFAVLKVGRERFGLIIDKVIGTEEIVVKPMHSILRTLKCYAGSTVMGDGRVALILDVDGIAEHAGILRDLEQDVEKESSLKEGEKLQKLLIFKSGELEQFALDVANVRRIEEIQASAIEKVGQREFVNISGISTPIIRLHNYLNVSTGQEKEYMFLVIPKSSKRCGVLISELLDITETSVRLNVESLIEDGILGTAIVRDKMTLFPDLQRLIRQLE
jgi:two-component system, chemotaxis family, sensor kinase CheA